MGKAELAGHQVGRWGRDYSESCDGYSDMEAEARRGWEIISGWGSEGWDLGHWPYVAFYRRNHGDGGLGLLEIVEGDRTEWRFKTEEDRAAALDYLFLWYAAHEDRHWSPARLEDKPRLEAGSLPVDEKFRGPYRPGPAPLFSLGQTLVATPAATDLMAEQGIDSAALLRRHATGDWGDIDEQDKAANTAAVTGGGRILSVYGAGAGKLYVITEWDRSVTTILTPGDY